MRMNIGYVRLTRKDISNPHRKTPHEVLLRLAGVDLNCDLVIRDLPNGRITICNEQTISHTTETDHKKRRLD